MIKCVFLLKRQPHLSREEFLAYWRDNHAALAKEIAGTMGIRRYIQLHPAEHPLGAALAASRGSSLSEWDGITECWWDSFEDIEKLAETSGDVAAAVLADEARFVDLSRSQMMFYEENKVIP